MVIRDVRCDKQTVFSEIKIGEGFEKDGRIYMPMPKVNGYNAFSLSDGCAIQFSPLTRVVPVKLTLVVQD